MATTAISAARMAYSTIDWPGAWAAATRRPSAPTRRSSASTSEPRRHRRHHLRHRPSPRPPFRRAQPGSTPACLAAEAHQLHRGRDQQHHEQDRQDEQGDRQDHPHAGLAALLDDPQALALAQRLGLRRQRLRQREPCSCAARSWPTKLVSSGTALRSAIASSASTSERLAQRHLAARRAAAPARPCPRPAGRPAPAPAPAPGRPRSAIVSMSRMVGSSIRHARPPRGQAPLELPVRGQEADRRAGRPAQTGQGPNGCTPSAVMSGKSARPIRAAATFSPKNCDRLDAGPGDAQLALELGARRPGRGARGAARSRRPRSSSTGRSSASSSREAKSGRTSRAAELGRDRARRRRAGAAARQGPASGARSAGPSASR